MAVKVTIGMTATLTGDRRYSWTESRWLPNSNDIAGGNDAVCESYAQARMGLCAGNVYLLSLRQSLFNIQANTGRPIAARQRNRILVPGDTIGTVTTGIALDIKSQGAFTTLFTDQPKASVQVALDGRIGDAGARGVGTLYLCGIPDAIIKTGPGGTPDTAAVPGWMNNFTSYLDTLKNGGFAYLGTTKPPTQAPLDIVAWGQETAAPNRLILTTESALPGWVKKVRVRGVRNRIKNTPRAVGLWRIALKAGPDGAGNFSYTLAESEDYTASDIITLGTVESVSQSFYLYLGTGDCLRATTRKRGASYGAAHGKSSARQRQRA